MKNRIFEFGEHRFLRIAFLLQRSRRDPGHPLWFFLDDDALAHGAPILFDVRVNLDHVAVWIVLVERAGDVMIHHKRKWDTRGLGPVIAVDHVGFGLEFKGEMPDPRLLILGSILAVDIGQREIVIGIPVAKEARLVVGLPINFLKTDYRLVEISRLLVVADKQICVPKTAWSEELFCVGGLLGHDHPPTSQRRIDYGTVRVDDATARQSQPAIEISERTYEFIALAIARKQRQIAAVRALRWSSVVTPKLPELVSPA